MCAGDERERDRALVSTAERYLGTSQERPALLQDGFRAARRLWRHYEGVVKAGSEHLAASDTDDRPDVKTISGLEDDVRILKLRLTESRTAFESLEAELADWQRHAQKSDAEVAEATDRFDHYRETLSRKEAERDELRKAGRAAPLPGAGDRSDMLEAVAAASLELSRTLSAFGDEESLLGAIRAITSDGKLSITFYVYPVYPKGAWLDVCVHARSGREDSDRVNMSANSSEVAEVLRRLAREVLEGLAEEQAAGGSSELEDALEEEERAGAGSL